MKKLILALVCAAGLHAQPPEAAIQHLFFYDGSGNLQYDCQARQYNVTNTWKVSDSSLTSIVVSTNVGTVTTASAHGLYIGARVTVSGSATSALNGTYTIATVPSSTTFTVATSGVSDATYNDSTLVFKTTNPVTNAPIWAVQVYAYASGNLTASYWAQGTGYAMKCDDRTKY